jgi:hypothetical protein
MPKFIFDFEKDPIYILDPIKGVMETRHSSSVVSYKFYDMLDKDEMFLGGYDEMIIGIRDQYFGLSDIDELIDFLKCAKEHITNITKK